MSDARVIYYACPDNPSPSGGVRRLYRHVEVLNRDGIEAFILHKSPDFRIGWFESDAQVRSFDNQGSAFLENNVLVIPEVMAPLMKLVAKKPIIRVAIALNWAYIYGCLPIGEDWRTYGITQAIAGSQCEREFILKTMGIDAHVLVSGTDDNLFHPRDERVLQIAYMPRKNSLASVILGVFRSIYPELNSIPIVPISDLSHRSVAQVLGQSAIFLTATFPEGLARPPLEAMASGCIVVGFAGRGALEYMKDGNNCYRADDGDVISAAHYLAKAVADIRNGQSQQMQNMARSTAMKYSLENEERRVLEYWRLLFPAQSPSG
jgi:hypothetical protein